jgi:hypothetical protein
VLLIDGLAVLTDLNEGVSGEEKNCAEWISPEFNFLLVPSFHFAPIKRHVRSVPRVLDPELKGSVSQDFLGPFLACMDRSKSV